MTSMFVCQQLCELKKREDLEEAILACVDPDQLPARESKSSHNSPEQQVDSSNIEMFQICSDLVFPHYQSIWKVAIGCVQGANLLQIFSMKGKTPFVTYLLEQGYEVLISKFKI